MVTKNGRCPCMVSLYVYKKYNDYVTVHSCILFSHIYISYICRLIVLPQ